MPRYRFTGRQTGTPTYCLPKECKPFIIVKSCPAPPYIKDSPCRPNIYDRAIVRHITATTITTTTSTTTTTCNNQTFKPLFVLETFSNLILCPVNLNQFCGYNFNDGEVVAVEAEDLSSVPNIVNPCQIDFPNSIPVTIFNIKRTWNLSIRYLTGIVSNEVDSNGVSYYMVTEFASSSNNNPITIQYEIYNIMGQEDLLTTLSNLVGITISASYVDYGTETVERLGIPIVIFDYILI